MIKILLGELFGTTLLVAIGCGSIIFGFTDGWPLWAIALCWGGSVGLSIVLLHRLSGVHLNPAVSISFLMLKKCSTRQFFYMLLGQLLGAILGGLLLVGLFSSTFNELLVEYPNQSVRVLAMQYPNSTAELTTLGAASWEFVGTFILVLSVLIVAHSKGNPWLAAIVVPTVLTGLIYWIAPYTQAGFNPARDLGPRLVAYFSHWSGNAFQQGWSVILVYTIAPLFAGLSAPFIFRMSQRILRSNENLRTA